jgi:predicted extracellular nuclease
MIRLFYPVFLVLLEIVFAASCFPQTTQSKKPSSHEVFRIQFYNTENFFDTFDDPNTADNEFLPDSKRHWTYKRYQQKLNNIYKVIISLGDQPPALVGMAEVENDLVLKDLTQKTPLLKFNYHFIHHDSPDPRGIDAALLYRPDQFKPLKITFYKVRFSEDARKRTREIVYVKGLALGTDTIHVFVNHWPSRVSGELKTERLRLNAAHILRQKTDSIMHQSPSAKIVIVGDFNDEPTDQSILNELKALPLNRNAESKSLYNLSLPWMKEISIIGTLKYKGDWSVFDQIIVSSSLLKHSTQGLKYLKGSAKIDDAVFLLIKDDKYGGNQPFRTYNGYKYTGGFSDHLPVYFDLYK